MTDGAKTPKQMSTNRFDNMRHVFTEAECKTLHAHYNHEVNPNDQLDMDHARSRDTHEDIMDMLHTIRYLRAQLEDKDSTISDQNQVMQQNTREDYSGYQN